MASETPMFKLIPKKLDLTVRDRSPLLSPAGGEESLEEWLDKVGCSIDKYIENAKILVDKGSASESIILFGQLKTKTEKIPVAFKIIFKTRDVFDNSLEVEKQLYVNIISNLLNNSHTPHLVSYIGLVKQCDTDKLVKTLPESEQPIFRNLLRDDIRNNKYDKDDTSILILKKSRGLTLGKATDGIQSSNDWYNILFQLLYTLRCFERIGLSHNDLHNHNIFIDILNPPVERVYYISDNVWVKILVKYNVLIYDFDRGSIYHPSVDRNFSLDKRYCDYDQCNKYYSRKDLSSALSSCINSYTRSYIQQIMSLDYLTNNIRKRVYRHLNTFTDKNGDFIPGPIPENKDLLSIAECIDKLIKTPDFKNETGTGGVKDSVVFTLPPSLNRTIWMPTSTTQHKSLNTRLDTEPVSNYLTDEYIDSLSTHINKFIKKDNIYESEFGKEYFMTNYKLLFKEYIKRKNISNLSHNVCTVACYILCIPFMYKLDYQSLITFLSMEIVSNSSLVPVAPLISDIWNVFNGTLPIAMIKV